MIRSRGGINVYGTNTELETPQTGALRRGRGPRNLTSPSAASCAEEYTLTVASHDPDGVWHDWLEDAIAFAVADSRYTAGVANLRAIGQRTGLPRLYGDLRSPKSGPTRPAQATSLPHSGGNNVESQGTGQEACPT